MCVDVQCIKQGLVSVADCYNTPLITTNPRCHIEGAEHVGDLGLAATGLRGDLFDQLALVHRFLLDGSE